MMTHYEELAKKLGIISDKDVCDCENVQEENPFGIERLKDIAYEERSRTALCLSDILTEYYARMKNSEIENRNTLHKLYQEIRKNGRLEEENSMLKKIIDKLTYGKNK